LVFDKISSFISTYEKMKKIIAEKGIKVLCPRHLWRQLGDPQRVEDMLTVSKGVIILVIDSNVGVILNRIDNS
jgi:uncharacterized membrane protein